MTKASVSQKPAPSKGRPQFKDSAPTKKVGIALAEREGMIQEFLPVIKYMALRLAMRVPAGLNVEDLISAGTVGLLDALGKFDPSREVKFRTYAEFRIRGAMLDEMRAMDWVPRSVRERIGRIQHAANEFTKRKGRTPTESELAAELGVDAEEVDEVLLQAKGTVVLSLDDLGTGEDDSHSIMDALADTDQPNPLESLLSEDTRKVLAEAIDRLPERQRLVLTLYYFEELTMKEIGSLLSVTESRICQLHAQAMVRLKAQLHTRLSR